MSPHAALHIFTTLTVPTARKLLQLQGHLYRSHPPKYTESGNVLLCTICFVSM